MSIAPIAPRRAFALYSPVQKGIIASGTGGNASHVRRYAIKIGTVYGGERPGETWRSLYLKGYRVIRVMIVPA